MTQVEGTLGSMLQGVSQQPARVRQAGQLKSQINMVSSLTNGLTTRPGTFWRGRVGDYSDGSYSDFEYQRVRHFVKFSTGNLLIGQSVVTNEVYDVNKPPFEVSNVTLDSVDLNGNSAYLGTDMVISSIDDVVWLLNRNVVVQEDPSTGTTGWKAIYASCLGGQFGRTYTLQVRVGSDQYTGSYTTPDGDDAGDAANSTSVKIIHELGTALRASINGAHGLSVDWQGDTLAVHNTNSTVATMVSNDGEGGTVLRVANLQTPSPDNLPRVGLSGTVIEIVAGSADRNESYYMEFISTGEDWAGYWRETFKRGERYRFNAATLPHVLVKTGSNSWRLDRGAWLGRRVGDAETNPMPDIAGHRIRDLTGFESRMAFSTDRGGIVFSRTNRPLDWFRKSVVASIATDPVVMSVSGEETAFDWMVPFDKSLVLMSDPGRRQYVVQGGGLSPDTANLSMTTSFEVNSSVRPAVTGNTVLFGFKNGVFGGIKEFFTNNLVNTNGADTLTQIVDQYIPSKFRQIATSRALNTCLVLADGGTLETRKSIWVYQYLWEGTERIHSSWSKWEFPFEILYVYFVDSLLYLLVRDDSGVMLMSMAVNGEGSVPCLDNMRYVKPETSGSFRVPYDNARVADYTQVGYTTERFGWNIGDSQEVTPASVQPAGSGVWDYVLPSWSSSRHSMIFGVTMPWSTEPTMPVIKDRNQAVMSDARLAIRYFNIRLENSGFLSVRKKVTAGRTTESVFKPNSYPMFEIKTRDSRTDKVAWRDLSERTQLEVFGTGINPVSIVEIDWRGDLSNVYRRV